MPSPELTWTNKTPHYTQETHFQGKQTDKQMAKNDNTMKYITLTKQTVPYESPDECTVCPA